MDLPDIYPLFNRLEGLLWFAIAVALPFVIKRRTRREALAVYLASLGFILFGITDFIEAPLYGQIPGWLWAFKIACAALILSCRYLYLGWHRFHLGDPSFLFGLFCLAATFGVIWLQHYLAK
jgi:hypothetical protein